MKKHRSRRRIVSLALTLCMMLGMVPAYAAESTEVESPATDGVEQTYTIGEDTEIIEVEFTQDATAAAPEANEIMLQSAEAPTLDEKRQQMKALLDEIEALDSKKCTAESWEALSKVVSELGDQNPLAMTDLSLDYYLPEITKRKEALVLATEVELTPQQKLEALLDKIDELNEDDYTRASKQNLFTVAASIERPVTLSDYIAEARFSYLSGLMDGLVQRTAQSDLSELLEDIDVLAPEDYTKETYDALMTARRGVADPSTLSNDDATQKHTELESLKNALVAYTQKQKLENLINKTNGEVQAGTLNSSTYTAESWAAVQAILDLEMDAVQEEAAEGLRSKLNTLLGSLRKKLTLADGTYYAVIASSGSSSAILNRAKIVAKNGTYRVTLYTYTKTGTNYDRLPGESNVTSSRFYIQYKRSDYSYPLVEVLKPRYNIDFPKGTEGYALKNLSEAFDLADSGYSDAVKAGIAASNNEKFYDSTYVDLGDGVTAVTFETADLGDEFVVNTLQTHSNYNYGGEMTKGSWSNPAARFTFDRENIVKLPDALDELNGKTYVKTEPKSNNNARNISRHPGVELAAQGGKIAATFSLDIPAFINYMEYAQSTEVHDAAGQDLDVSGRTVTFVYNSYDELIAGKYVELRPSYVDPRRTGPHIGFNEFELAVDFRYEPVTLTSTNGAKLYTTTKFVSEDATLTVTPVTEDNTKKELWDQAMEKIPGHGKESFFTLEVTADGENITDFGGNASVEVPKVDGLNDSAIRLFLNGFNKNTQQLYGWDNSKIVAHEDCYSLLLDKDYFHFNWYIYDEKMSDKTGADLDDGTYTVPITTFNKAQPSQLSMSAECLGERATLVKKGDALYLKLDFEPVDIGAQKGYLIQMWVKQKDGTEEELSYTGYYKNQDDSFLTDDLNEGTLNYYPKSAYMRLPTTDVQFTTRFRVSAMDSIMPNGDATREAIFTIYYDDAVKQSDETPDIPVREALTAELEVAGACVEADYTAGSWAGLKAAVETAEAAAAKETATIEELVQAHSVLRATIDGLIAANGSTAALTALIARAESYKQADYTAATYTVLAKALADAKAIAATGGDQEEIDRAAAALQSAINNLKSNVSAGVESGEGLKDGNYYVEIALWHATDNKESMGNVAFKNNNRALVTVSGGKVTTVQVATNPVDVSGYHSAIITFKVNDGAVTVLEKKALTTTAGKDYQYISLARFTMPTAGQPGKEDETYVNVEFYVPDTPMDEVVGDTLNARLKFYWNTMTETGDSSLESDDSSAKGTSSLTGKEIVELNLIDPATSITITSDTEALLETAQISVTKPGSGADYDNAVKAMKGIDGWTLYKIVTLVDGKETAPSGSVTVSIPCTDEGLSIYRISASGTKTTIRGKVENGYYVFSTSQLGLFAVVGKVNEAVILEDLTDQDTGIRLTSAQDVLPDGATMTVKEVKSGKDYNTIEAELKDKATKFAAYTISTKTKAGKDSTPTGTVTLAFPIPSDYAGKRVVVYLLADGKLTEMKGAVSATGKTYNVETDKLGTFVLAEKVAGVLDDFTDLNGHWARESIEVVVEKGLFSGTGKTTFSPNTDMTRGMFVTVLGRLYGAEITGGKTAFVDVPEEQWYAPYVKWAAENGIVHGTSDATFEPDRAITRQEMAVMLKNYMDFANLKLEGDKALTFADADNIAAWAKEAVDAMTKAGLLQGTGDNCFSPAKTATRAEVATLLARFIQTYKI